MLTKSFTPDQTQAITFLRRDPLRNIVLLKMLAAFPAAIETHYAEHGADVGVLLRFPTVTFAYDRHTYPDADSVVLIATTKPELAAELLTAVPRDRPLIFKLMDRGVQQLVAASFAPLQRVTAFMSYTATEAASFKPWSTVVVSAQVDECCYPLFAMQGYTRAEVDAYLADSGARTFTLYQGQEAIAACFTYRNFEQIFEIGGVVTLPSERRKGHARKVVTTAVATLLQANAIPRYQVHETNQPSLALAEQIGLQPFATIEHWRYQP
ncbi:MAG: GNAT family N-acetyltransferase [Caldilineaceae bacterium]